MCVRASLARSESEEGGLGQGSRLAGGMRPARGFPGFPGFPRSSPRTGRPEGVGVSAAAVVTCAEPVEPDKTHTAAASSALNNQGRPPCSIWV